MKRGIAMAIKENKPNSLNKFLVIWSGELLSTIGSGLTSFGLGVWMFEKTGLATTFALTVLCAYLPNILISPFAGTLVDRWNRRLIMIISDTGDAIVTLVVVLLLHNNLLEIWHIYLIVGISAIFSTFQELAFAAGVTMLVPKKDLARSGGLMQMGQAIQLTISPILAGLLYAKIGLYGIIFIDFITYFFALTALFLIQIPQPESNQSTDKNSTGSFWRDTLLGGHYLLSQKGLLALTLFFIPVNFLLNFPAVLLGPLVLSFSTTTVYGLIQTVSGIGMIGGSLLMGIWGDKIKNRTRAIICFVLFSAFGLGLLGIQPKILWICLGYSIILFCIPFISGTMQGIFQDKVEPSVQGRVFAFKSLLSRSLLPLAYLMAGILADKIFNPLLMPNGKLSKGTIGSIIGIGPGRGIGLMFIISAVFLFFVCIMAWKNTDINSTETG